MSKSFQIRLFCKGQSFKSQFAARLLTFYGRRHEADQGSDLTEDDVIEKFQNSDFKDLSLKFLIEDFEFEIIWQNDKMIENKSNNTIFVLLLELEKSLQIIQSLQNYEMTQDCFFIIIDTISEKKKEENIKNFEKKVLQKINENLAVYVSEANIISIFLDIKSQENKKIICNRLVQAAKCFRILESKSKFQKKQKFLDQSLTKIIQKYQINDVQQFTKDVKLGDIRSGTYHIDDRRVRKKLQKELQSLEILNQFLQQNLKLRQEQEQKQMKEKKKKGQLKIGREKVGRQCQMF